jgi:hypothetical protein
MEGSITMKKRLSKALMKQIWKYIIIIILFAVGMFIYRVMWELSMKVIYVGLIIAGAILLISILFDFISIKDILPIFKG